MTKPKVSIIIPVYKVEKYIQKCVVSLFEQTLPELEYIFIDDCGGDKSIEIVKDLSKSYPDRKPQIKIIVHESNLGVSQSRQDGIDNANGEYIIHCDPDDWVDVDMYENMYTLGKSKNADIVCCDYMEHCKDKTIAKKNLFNHKDIIKDIFYGKVHSSLWSRLIKSSYIKKTGVRFNPTITIMEDMHYVVPLLLKTDEVAYIQEPYYHYRTNNESITHTLTYENINSELYVLNELKNAIKDHEDMIEAWKSAVLCRAQALITHRSLYDPERWRKVTADIKYNRLPLMNRISPWLIKNHFDTLNYYIISLFRCIERF